MLRAIPGMTKGGDFRDDEKGALRAISWMTARGALRTISGMTEGGDFRMKKRPADAGLLEWLAERDSNS